MRAVDVIMKKRDGHPLERGEIKWLMEAYVAGEAPDYQIASWLMAVFLRGMTPAETAALTEVMLHSGSTIELHGFPGLTGPFVDKHSTGGVGDKLSLPLAPIAAACGLQVPMMSGRALGHTGGTLDKLESMTGYRVNLSPDEFRAGIAADGFAMMGQTRDIVPADRLLYALRDVTGTVESIPLITASILSKKIAEGADALVFDVKYGKGAFMKSLGDAELLAESLVKTATSLTRDNGCVKAAAVITNMDSPLGYKVGNFLEIEETIECLQGRWPADVKTVTYALAEQMLLLGGKAKTREEAAALIDEAVTSGKALDLFYRNIDRQGGDAKLAAAQCGKRRSPHRADVTAEKDGYVAIDAFKVGLAGVTLGVGRNRTEDAVCPDAGLVLHVKEGDRVHRGDFLMEVYGKDALCLESAVPGLASAVTYSEKPLTLPPLIAKIIGEGCK